MRYIYLAHCLDLELTYKVLKLGLVVGNIVFSKFLLRHDVVLVFVRTILSWCP